ncbi:DUF1978 domain-containing protein [Chlamydia pneumoniae]|uniref:DUF1978 domain-containing protein n=1 Tax=Chlamydia pneumoniae TaxID=83558 RepID=UPI0038901827
MKTTFLKRLHRKCALAKTTFEKKRSEKNLQAVEEANARRLKYVRDWRRSGVSESRGEIRETACFVS